MRAAVLLRYYEDMTEAEVAEVLGVSLGTVKSTVSRAVAKLRIDADAPVRIVPRRRETRLLTAPTICRYRELITRQGGQPARPGPGNVGTHIPQGVTAVRSTMMDVPLTVTAIMRHGTHAYPEPRLSPSRLGDAGGRHMRKPALRAAKLANALRSLGVDGDQRVATLMWNNAEHLEAYLAVPSMGAVLHTLNLRLDPAGHRLHR